MLNGIHAYPRILPVAHRFGADQAASRLFFREGQWNDALLLQRLQDKLTGLLTGDALIIGQNPQIRMRNLVPTTNDTHLVFLEGGQDISPTHASIQRLPNNGFLLQDQNSTAGVYVNNRRINKPVEVHPNDTIRLGQGFTFQIPEDPFQKIFRVPPKLSVSTSALQLQYALVHSIEVLPSGQGKQSVLLIGRHPDCNFQVPDGLSSFSRRHAKITRRADGSLTVEDLKSLNGTTVNGKQLIANTPTPLKQGDEVSFGTGFKIVIP